MSPIRRSFMEFSTYRNFMAFAEKLTEFLKSVKGAVPALSATSDHTVDILASVRSTDEDEEDDADQVVEEIDDMDIDISSSARTTRRQNRQGKLKYMEQLQRIADRRQKGLVIELKDIAEVSTQLACRNIRS